MVDPIRIMFVVKILRERQYRWFRNQFYRCFCWRRRGKWKRDDLFTIESSNGHWQVRTADAGGTEFTWRHQGSWGTVYGEMYPADFNGDGRTDFIEKANGYWRINWRMLVGQTLLMEDRAHGERNTDIVYLGDLIAMDERICLRRRAQMVLAGTRTADAGRTGFTSTASGSWGTVYGEMYPADFNGDGRTDFLSEKANGYYE